MSEVLEQPAAPAVPEWEERMRGIVRIASLLDGARTGTGPLGRGDIAELRREASETPPSVFWRLMEAALPGKDFSMSQEQRWLTLIRGMSILAPRSHDRSVSLGAAMVRAGYAGTGRLTRMERLLGADQDVFPGMWLTMCRMMASKGVSFDQVKAADLILFPGSQRAEAARYAIARNANRSLLRKPKSGNN